MEIWEWILLIGGYILSGVLGYIYGKARSRPSIHGIIRLVYDPDDPDHPAMGLVLENMDYIMSQNCIYLGIEKKNFPS